MWFFELGWSHCSFYVEMIIRLAAACVLGGVIGYEREHVHRPAGFRTHILVCVGSALVMVTSEFIYYTYSSQVNLDPARLGAQVISGIGFLGAGTIIKEGVSVKGLTTAASLWAVSCIGIAVGIGFYSGAVIATAVIYFTLIILKKLQSKMAINKITRIFVHTCLEKGQINEVTELITSLGVIITRLVVVSSEKDGELVLKITLDNCDAKTLALLTETLLCHRTVRRVYED